MPASEPRVFSSAEEAIANIEGYLEGASDTADDMRAEVARLTARLDAPAAERDELLIASRECRESMSRAMTAMARDVVTINDLKSRLAAAEAERDVLTARLAAASDSISDSGESSRLSE